MTATKPGTVVANGDAIRRNRKARGLSREALSMLTNGTVSVSTVRRAEASKRVYSIVVRHIAAVLRVDESRLINRNEQRDVGETHIKEIWESIIKLLNQRKSR